MSYFPTQSTLNIAGLTITTPPSGLIYLTTFMNANSYGTLRKVQSTAGYTPSGANKFICIGGWMISSSSGVGISTHGLGYGDTDVGLDSAAAPTTPVYIGGNSDAASVIGVPAPTASQVNAQFLAGFFEIPNGKYPFFIRRAGNAALALWLVGYEQA